MGILPLALPCCPHPSHVTAPSQRPGQSALPFNAQKCMETAVLEHVFTTAEQRFSYRQSWPRMVMESKMTYSSKAVPVLLEMIRSELNGLLSFRLKLGYQIQHALLEIDATIKTIYCFGFK